LTEETIGKDRIGLKEVKLQEKKDLNGEFALKSRLKQIWSDNCAEENR
jgi:hypothetical protein